MEKIGLIAGNRKFPLIFAEAARKKNYSVLAVAIKGDTSFKLKAYVDKIYWLKMGEFRQLFEIFKEAGIKQVVMAGQISPQRLFSPEVEKDEGLKKMLECLKDKKADTIFSAIAEKLKEEGIELISSTTFIEEYLPKKGTLTSLGPDTSTWEDIYFGLDLARAIAGLDIGQTVAIKSKAVVAVEALEGTDNLIRRAGRVAGNGVTIIKVSKPKQDVRFDIPVVGLNTIKNLIRARGKCLAIEAGKTLFIDREKSVRLADTKGISIVVF